MTMSCFFWVFFFFFFKTKRRHTSCSRDWSSDVCSSDLHQPVTFTAMVSSADGVPSGVVSFLDGSTTLGSVPLQNGSATLTTKALDLGDHTITASYAGSSSFAASGSAPLTHHVVKGTPQITIASSASHPAYGDGVMRQRS